MIRTSFLASLALVTALGATACRGGSSGDDTGDDVDGGNTDDVSIYDIQGSLPLDGSPIDIRGVVVTAIDTYGERKGNIWVQEPAGGAYSGVLVFGIALDDVADLAVGDLIDVEHVVKDEFALVADDTGRTTTEMVPPDGGAITVTKVGDGTVPDPEVVDALAIGLMAEDARDAEWEKWEGVLITLQNVTVNKELDQIGDAQDPPFEEIRITGPMRADTSLSPIEPVTRGTCLASITGIGDYFFNYKLLPRSTDDVVGSGTGCPEEESGTTACADGIDNDADGSFDCDDFGCDDLPECTTDTTVVDIQTMPALMGVNVSLNDVFVTAIDDNGTTANPDSNKGFWVADALAGAASNGVYVYTGSSVPAGIEIGAVVDVVGTVDEFDLGLNGQPAAGDTITQVEVAVGGVTVVSAPASLPTPLTGVTVTTLSNITATDPGLGEPYESVLVQVGPAKVTLVASGGRRTLVTADGTFLMDNESLNYAGTDYPVDTCFTSVTGVMVLNIFDNDRRIAPRLVGDLVVDADGSDCSALP